MRRSFLVFTALSLLALVWGMNGCATSDTPLPTPDKVNLDKFMGSWFVHGYTPILVDGKAHNAVEHYYLNDDNEVETTYQFRDGSFDGELKTFKPKGFPAEEDESGARWKMQFIWPFKSDYVIVHVSEDYQSTIIGHPSRKYAWIMDRKNSIDEASYKGLLKLLDEAGYDVSIVQRLPQDWSNEAERLKTLKEVGASAPQPFHLGLRPLGSAAPLGRLRHRLIPRRLELRAILVAVLVAIALAAAVAVASSPPSAA
ncbi:MAG: lipocalin family protein, partial [Opitutales bacterium]